MVARHPTISLRNLHLPGGGEALAIRIANGRIAGADSWGASALSGTPALPKEKTIHLDFEGALVFPGLINSHDHLDFNLFPRLGNGIYANYKEWGRDIHLHNKALIDPVLRIPQELRVQWGVYKNLLNGVTTVINHGRPLTVPDGLITILQPLSLHSLGTEKNWKYTLNKYYKKKPAFVIHIGEGTDKITAGEVDDLIRWNIFRRDLIGIHGVAMGERQAASFRALIWCPDSNYFLFSMTAPIDLLKHKTRMLFGTDSTLTAGWNLWEQLRLARAQKMTGDAELLDMLTRTPADIWGLEDSGSLHAGRWADMVVADVGAAADAKATPGTGGVSGPEAAAGTGIAAGIRDAAGTIDAADSWNAFYGLNPDKILLVLHKGTINLFDASLYDQLAACHYPLQDFYKIRIGEKDKYVRGDLPRLMRKILHYHPSANFPSCLHSSG